MVRLDDKLISSFDDGLGNVKLYFIKEAGFTYLVMPGSSGMGKCQLRSDTRA